MAVKAVIALAVSIAMSCALCASNLIVVRGHGGLVAYGSQATQNWSPATQLLLNMDNVTTDASQYARNTGIYSGVDSFVSGQTGFGQAVHFGSTGSADYSNPYYAGMSSSNMTMECFIKTPSVNLSTVPVMADIYASSAHYAAGNGFAIYFNMVASSIGVVYGNSTQRTCGGQPYGSMSESSVTSIATLPNTWYHVLAQVSGNTLYVSRNGSFLVSMNITTTTAPSKLGFAEGVNSGFQNCGGGDQPTWYTASDIAIDSARIKSGIVYPIGPSYSVPSGPLGQ